MFPRFVARRGRGSLWVLVLVGCCGCGPRGYDRYVPAEETARQALEASLKAWQAGQPPGRIDGPGVTVRVVDGHRRAGQKLAGYAVLGETAGDGPRCFAVRLRFEGPREEQKARFVVLGIDPLWVYRYEDYQAMAHWECRMDDEAHDKEAPPRKGGAAQASSPSR
jgi:hypothetical protein